MSWPDQHNNICNWFTYGIIYFLIWFSFWFFHDNRKWLLWFKKINWSWEYMCRRNIGWCWVGNLYEKWYYGRFFCLVVSFNSCEVLSGCEYMPVIFIVWRPCGSYIERPSHDLCSPYKRTVIYLSFIRSNRNNLECYCTNVELSYHKNISTWLP